MATSYHQLGIVGQLRDDYEQALNWYRQALAINEELGNPAGVATTISQIGALITRAGRAADAVACAISSLAIKPTSDPPRSASTCFGSVNSARRSATRNCSGSLSNASTQTPSQPAGSTRPATNPQPSFGEPRPYLT
jgi:tetratricopeptide (TPR) repeat protein